MATIHFQTKLFNIGECTLLLLPKSESVKLPSRGMVMVKGTINGSPFQAALEPDGRGSHWFKVDEAMQEGAKANVDDTVGVEIESIKEWPEPNIPKDLKDALKVAPRVEKLWQNITPMARWDWIRWIGSTKNLETRKKRIEVELSKLRNGEKRLCCFNRSMCTDPYVSSSGVLLEQSQT